MFANAARVASVTVGWYTIIIKLSKKSMELAVTQMTEALVPEAGVVCSEEAAAAGGFIGGGAQRVEVPGGVTVEQCRPHSEIFMEKLKGSKVIET